MGWWGSGLPENFPRSKADWYSPDKGSRHGEVFKLLYWPIHTLRFLFQVYYKKPKNAWRDLE